MPDPEPEVGPQYDLLTGQPIPATPPVQPDPPAPPPPPFELPDGVRPGWIPPGFPGTTDDIVAPPTAP